MASNQNRPLKKRNPGNQMFSKHLILFISELILDPKQPKIDYIDTFLVSGWTFSWRADLSVKAGIF